MSFCRRCARALNDSDLDPSDFDEAYEEAIELDIRDAVDENLAAIWDTAFNLAEANATATVGVEHLVNAMTLVASTAAFLHARGVDVEALRRESGRVVAAGASDDALTEFDLDVDIDLETSYELAVTLAESAERSRATMDDLLEVLANYEAGVPEVQGLVALLSRRRGAARAQDRLRTANFISASTVPPIETLLSSRPGSQMFRSAIALSPDNATQSRATAASLDTAGFGPARGSDDTARRLDAIDRRLADLARHVAFGDASARVSDSGGQNARHGAVEQRRMQAADTAGQAACSQVSAVALDLRPLTARLDELAAAQRRIDERLAATLHADRDRPLASSRGAQSTSGEARLERMLEMLSRALERQNDEIVRLSERVASWQPRTGERPARGSAVSGTTREADVASHPNANDGGSRMLADNANRRGSRKGRGGDGKRQRRRRHYGALGFATVSRGIAKRMPSRRERSWWPYLGDPLSFRQARRNGGLFRAWGERASRQAVPRRGRNMPRGVASPSEKRFYLALDHDIVHAPSIGPRTAERLRAARILKVRDLLTADLEQAAHIIATRHITPTTLADWRDQARLVCAVPFLRGTHAQLLVGAGFRTPEAVAAAASADVLSAILRYAATRDGQSVLRNGPPPEPEKIEAWVRNAGEAELARVA
ncbi:MAG: DUF4332 domain-containing protein [Hyphomicrobiaceae bacterium]|nr:DUF4332 domain-containing protein [Hyphomicrobiaceae bacterium]